MYIVDTIEPYALAAYRLDMTIFCKDTETAQKVAKDYGSIFGMDVQPYFAQVRIRQHGHMGNLLETVRECAKIGGVEVHLAQSVF